MGMMLHRHFEAERAAEAARQAEKAPPTPEKEAPGPWRSAIFPTPDAGKDAPEDAETAAPKKRGRPKKTTWD